MFDRLTETLQTAFKKLRGKGLLNEKAVDEGLREIRRALLELGLRGYYVEPTSAATIAGLKKYLKESSVDELIVSTLTGSGLKETEKIAEILDKR